MSQSASQSATRARKDTTLIGGDWLAPATRETIAVINPSDGGRQLRLAKALKSGQVFINNFGAGGGVKRTGHGREKGFEALFHFSALKTVAIKHG
jgi:acyl-CoA reductase-like NAD-dependent aldehyde dehydrogenase